MEELTYMESILDGFWPAVAFCISLVLVVRTEGEAKAYISMLCMMSLAQAVGTVILPWSPESAFILADVYLISGYWALAFAIAFLNTLQERKFDLTYWYMAPLFLTLCHLAGLTAEGYVIKDRSPMHLDGPASFLVDAYVWICLLGSSALAGWGLYVTKNGASRSKYILYIIASVSFIAAMAIVTLINYFYSAGLSLRSIGPFVLLINCLVFAYISREKVLVLSQGIAPVKRRLSLIPLILEEEDLLSEAINDAKEKRALQDALDRTDTMTAAADHLGIHRNSLRRKLNKHGIS